MINFSYSIGNSEVHKVEFYFNQFWGNVFIKIDGGNIIRDIRIISFSLTKVYEFNVGSNEVHSVKIELIRKLLFAGFRKYRAQIFIDEFLEKEYSGDFTLSEIIKIKK